MAPRSRWHRALPDLLGVLWFVAVGVALLVPALRHGTHIGTYDILSQLGLSKHSGIIPHNVVNGDQIDSMIPWNDLVWTQVHHGQIPLWNPYNGLGLPLAFDWQSAPMGMPALVGYLVPLQYSYDVGILVTLVVAGTGVYVLGRVLGLGRLACVFAGTVFELSGSLGGWLGYPHGAVMSWGGWLFAAAILVVRREHRVRDISFFAVVLAMAVYSGQPEVLTVFGLGLGLFTAVLMAQRTTVLRGSGPIIRPLGDLVAASLAGLALAAPLALPGLQLISRSTRSGSTAVKTLQLHDFMYFISQGFDGVPIAGSRVFGESFFYEETAAYVGIIAVVLAVLALSVGFRRPETSRILCRDGGHGGNSLCTSRQLVDELTAPSWEGELDSKSHGCCLGGGDPVWIRFGRDGAVPRGPSHKEKGCNLLWFRRPDASHHFCRWPWNASAGSCQYSLYQLRGPRRWSCRGIGRGVDVGHCESRWPPKSFFDPSENRHHRGGGSAVI